jgi:hypothetical protein
VGSRERAVDERRSSVGDARVVELACSEVPGREALDQHVGGVDQREQLLAVARVVEVEHHTALASVGDHRPHVPALRVAGRRFDLHHVGAVIAERHRRHRTGETGGQVDDTQSLECTGHQTLVTSTFTSIVISTAGVRAR